MATLLTLGWELRWRLPLLPLRLAGALLGLALGFVLVGVLTAYLPPVAALPLGSLLALLGAGRRSGRRAV